MGKGRREINRETDCCTRGNGVAVIVTAVFQATPSFSTRDVRDSDSGRICLAG